MKRKGLFVIAILLLPSLLYVFFALGKANFRKLPYHGPKAVRDSFIEGKQVKDTIYYSIPSFTVSDADGQAVDSKTLSGKIYIAGFIDGWGEATAKQLKGLAEYAVLKKEELRFMQFVFFVQADSTSALPQLADTLNIPQANCLTYYASKEQMDKIKPLFFVPVGGLTFKHTRLMVLVDEHGHIRGFHDPGSITGVKTLVEDFQHLSLHDEAEETKKQFKIEKRNP